MAWKKRETVADSVEETNSYFSLLLAETDPEKKQEKIKVALEYAHDIRKFEIELFWKRATYFWVFISLIALAYGSLLSFLITEKIDPPYFKNFLFAMIMLFNSLGIIISYIWYLAMKGSKFWQVNWETHIDMLEFYVTGNLHKVLFKSSPKQVVHSVSKLSKAVALCCMIAWCLVLIAVLVICVLEKQCIWSSIIFVSIIFIILACWFITSKCISTSAS